MIWFSLILLGVGLVIGAIARFLLPGRDPLSVGGTWVLGVLGSLVGGFLGYVLFGADVKDGPVQAAGFIGSVLGAMLLLVIWRFYNRRTHVTA